MNPWRGVLRVSRHEVKLLILNEAGQDTLKARFAPNPQHPRAMLTLLEGLALYSGHRLTVALSAGVNSPAWLCCRLLGNELWPAESQLVAFTVARRAKRLGHLSGLGDFRALRFGPGGRG